MRNLGQKTERRKLKEIGARRQPGSGNIPGLPNDGIKGRYLIEIKSTTKASLGLKREWLETLEENAVLRKKLPVMLVCFNEPTFDDDWIVLRRSDFENLSSDFKK